MPNQTCTCDGAPFVGPSEHIWPCPLRRTSAQLDNAMAAHYEDEARAADPEFEAGPSRFMEVARDA